VSGKVFAIISGVELTPVSGKFFAIVSEVDS
jgi:hypothetical protein